MVVSAGALPFFRDPYEGDEEPMRALMTLGLGQQLEREAYALSCLACLTVLLLHIPLRLTKAALPGLLPLRLSLSSPFAEAPTDLLLFHFILPLTVPRMRVRWPRTHRTHPKRRSSATLAGVCASSLLSSAAFLCCDRFLMVRGVRLWLRAASRLLGLEDYLLPQPAGNLPGGQDQQQHQAPAFIPLGLGVWALAAAANPLQPCQLMQQSFVVPHQAWPVHVSLDWEQTHYSVFCSKVQFLPVVSCFVLSRLTD